MTIYQCSTWPIHASPGRLRISLQGRVAIGSVAELGIEDGETTCCWQVAVWSTMLRLSVHLVFMSLTHRSCGLTDLVSLCQPASPSPRVHGNPDGIMMIPCTCRSLVYGWLNQPSRVTEHYTIYVHHAHAQLDLTS